MTVEPGVTVVPVAPVMPVAPAVVDVSVVDGDVPVMPVPVALLPVVLVPVADTPATPGIVLDVVVVVVDAEGVLLSVLLAAGGTTTVSFFWQAVSAIADTSAVISRVCFMLLLSLYPIGRRLVRPWWRGACCYRRTGVWSRTPTHSYFSD
jgi:hypothetical protein